MRYSTGVISRNLLKHLLLNVQYAKELNKKNCQYLDLLNPLTIPNMAWTFISIDFVEGLPKSVAKDAILVVVDRLTKYAHFLPLLRPYTAQGVAHLFIDNVIKLHGPPAAIVTERDRVFTSKLWQDIFKSMRVTLQFSTTYHPQTNEQIERVNQCLEAYL
jgi:hypothetical protein